MNKKGCLVISLDFELMWGCKDWATIGGYGTSNIKNVPNVINKMLELFAKYKVHATFATVGMIMFSGKEDLLKSLPTELPSYKNKKRSPYEDNYIKGIDVNDYPLFFQSDIVNRIKQCKGMEIGTHTFCHYYCLEKGQTLNQFESDIRKAILIAKDKGIDIKSIVFPKNNVSGNYLDVCEKIGLTSYRGNPLKYFDDSKCLIVRYKNRLFRMVDSYIPINRHLCYPYESLVNPFKKIKNIPASRFFRPYNRKLSIFEFLKIKRIKKEIRYAAIHNEVYHLWWHPHNFGSYTDVNLEQLEEILVFYSKCREEYGMMSCTMNELASII